MVKRGGGYDWYIVLVEQIGGTWSVLKDGDGSSVVAGDVSLEEWLVLLMVVF